MRGQDMIDNIHVHCFRSQAADLKALRVVLRELKNDVSVQGLS